MFSISEVGNVDIQKNDLSDEGTFVVSSGMQNNGIIGRTKREANIHKKNTITVDMFGNVFYQGYEYKMVTHARVFNLIPTKFDMKRQYGEFFCSLLRHSTYEFSYSHMCSYKKIKDKTLFIPITANGEINFDFMENFISELEEERISELEKFLKVAGFEDCTLTEGERKALENSIVALLSGEILK